MNPIIKNILVGMDSGQIKTTKPLKDVAQASIITSTCIECGRKTNPAKYKKQIDRDEFYISGVCKTCQKLYFPPEPKD